MDTTTVEPASVSLELEAKRGLTYRQLSDRAGTMYRALVEHAGANSEAARRALGYLLKLNQWCDFALPGQPVADALLQRIKTKIEREADLCDFGKRHIWNGLVSEKGPDRHWRQVMRKGYGESCS